MARKSAQDKKNENEAEKYNQRLAQTGRDHLVPALSNVRHASRSYDSGDWRHLRGTQEKYQGVYVFAPVDPYTQIQREEFRSATSNPYVYRAMRIATSFVCGNGYTTSIVPREEEDLPDEQEQTWAATTMFNIPYFDKEMSAEEIKDWVDKYVKKLKLQFNLFNGYFVALEQGRCVLALTPLEPDPNTKKWGLPEQIRLIRTEFTLRPLLDNNTGELKGCYAVGVRTKERTNIIPAERMIYIMHGFNNELYSDYYGDSKNARISDIANTLNVILNQDYPNAAKTTWHKPGILVLPIPPQEFGNEQTITTQVANKLNEAEGKTVVLTGPSNKDDLSPQWLPGDKYADISGLETMRTGLIKGLVTAFGMPAFMLSEGDVGSLGGNSFIEEIDSYLNTEAAPEKSSLEETVENQIYDRILCVLFDVEKPDDLPLKIKHKFNKPKLITLLPPDLYNQLIDMTSRGLIDEEGLRDMLGLTELDKETMTEGANTSPDQNQWRPSWKSPIQINMWPGQDGSVKTTTSAWGQDIDTMPRGWKKTTNGWEQPQKTNNAWNGSKSRTWH